MRLSAEACASGMPPTGPDLLGWAIVGAVTIAVFVAGLCSAFVGSLT